MTKRIGLGGMRREKWQLLIDQLVALGDLKPDAAGKLPDAGALFAWDIDAGTAR